MIETFLYQNQHSSQRVAIISSQHFL